MKVGEQFSVDPQRVKYYQEKHELLHVEMEPGDAVFFHSKDTNVTDHPPGGGGETLEYWYCVTRGFQNIP